MACEVTARSVKSTQAICKECKRSLRKGDDVVVMSIYSLNTVSPALFHVDCAWKLHSRLTKALVKVDHRTEGPPSNTDEVNMFQEE